MVQDSSPPTESDIRRYAELLGLSPDVVDVYEVREDMTAQDELISKLDDLPSPSPPDREFWEVDEEDDPNAAFLVRCDLKESDEGRLDGLEMGIKDNIAVGGVPMTCGSPVLADYRPSRDATVVERLLGAGARIVGKTNMDEFALGGGERTMRFRLAHNPHERGYQPGGSSAGSGVAVAEGTVDAALGSDTGGSVRFPASFCGVVGVKPTRGLVPLDGFVQYSKTVDTIGVLARDVAVAGETLTAVSGPDPRDESTLGTRAGDYSTAAADGRAAHPSTLTVGVPDALFEVAERTAAPVRAALDTLEDAGSEVRSVSIPDFEYAIPAWLGIAMTEMGAYMRENAVHLWQQSTPLPKLPQTVAEALEMEAASLGDPVIDSALYGQYLSSAYENRYYARGQVGRVRVTEGVDDALTDVDVLAGPTTPMLPPAWGDGYLDDGGLYDAMRNTAPFNLTGHPAVSVPCGTVDGLPVGLQFVAPHFEETTALRAAALWESLHGEP